MARPRVDVTTSDRPGATLVEVEGEIDLSTAAQLQRELTMSVAAGSKLVVDVRGVTFIDSTGVGVLFRTSKKVTAAGGEMRLVCGPGPVRRVLMVSGLDRLVPVVDDLDAAVA